MKQYSGNHSFLKDLNIIHTLRLIQEKVLISRAALADALGLNRSTITAIVGELLQQQLVLEVGIGAPKGGRPPTLLQFNSDAAYTVSIEWSREQVRLYVANLGGELVSSRRLPSGSDRPDPDPADRIREVIRCVHEALEPLPPRPLGLLGIGIVVPGLVERGAVTSYSLDWTSVPLVSLFADIFDCPIVVNNDAHAGLIAESYFGSARGEQHVLYLHVGSSLSAAFTMNGQMLSGSEGFAGRIGHNTLVEGGRRCVCGKRGCWEAYVSERALFQRYGELKQREGGAGVVQHESTSESDPLHAAHPVITAALRSDPLAVRAVQELSQQLGQGAAGLVNLLNPRLVVIGHTFGAGQPLLIPAFETALHKRVLPFLRRNLQVHFTPLNERTLILGATALVLDAVFSPPTLGAFGSRQTD